MKRFPLSLTIADYDHTLKSIPDYDASDYIDGDFDRVKGTPSQQRTTKIQFEEGISWIFVVLC